MENIKLEITVTRGGKERPLSKAMPDNVWREELVYKFESMWSSLREFGSVEWEIK